jgi:hypothetical protein
MPGCRDPWFRAAFTLVVIHLSAFMVGYARVATPPPPPKVREGRCVEAEPRKRHKGARNEPLFPAGSC